MRRIGRHGLLLITIAAVMLLACGGTVLAQPGHKDSARSTKGATPKKGRALQSKKLQVVDPEVGQKGTLSAAQKLAMGQGYLVQDQAAYEKKKAEANRKAKQSSNTKQQSSAGNTSGKSAVTDLLRSESVFDKSTPAKSASSFARRHKKRATTTPETKKPVPVASSEGAFDSSAAPSDSTSAAGLDRYIELINRQFAIYSLTTTTLLGQGTLNNLVGSTGNVFDPQVMWDPATNRFYYAAALVFSSTDNRIAFGFSKTATPSSAADFCQYSISFGSRFEDYPKLGDTQNFLLIGANAFSSTGTTFFGADLSFVSKPPAGTITTCPLFGSFTTGRFQNISVGGAGTFTPVPAQQIDGSTTGYIVAEDNTLPSTRLPVFTAIESGGTIASPSGKFLSVPRYDFPPSAQQPGTTNLLDTMDARPTQAVSAIDPSQGNKIALWTQHTILGGGPNPTTSPTSSSVRWYEIDPSVPSTLRSEQIFAQGVNLFLFNAAVSADRVVNGTDKRFGDTMFLGMSYSSTSLNPGILLANKIGSNVVSYQDMFRSPAHLDDFSCYSPAGPPCRWGDYSGTHPVPSTPVSAAHGQMLHTNQYVRTQGTGTSSPSTWGTKNFIVNPS